jgi:DNA-directed RNA polymerase specialized sigma24 family protein
LTSEFLKRDSASIATLIASDQGKMIYTACLAACLYDDRNANALFKNTLCSVFQNAERTKISPELRLWRHFHLTWADFSRDHTELNAVPLPVRFDWSQIDVRQGRGALFMLDPAEREIFIYRFLFKYSIEAIAQITLMEEETLKNLFHAAMRKVVSS